MYAYISSSKFPICRSNPLSLKYHSAEWRVTVIVLSVCLSFCLSASSSEPTNIGTLKIVPADDKSYKDQKAFAKTFLF